MEEIGRAKVGMMQRQRRETNEPEYSDGQAGDQPSVSLFGRRIRIPRSRFTRVASGSALVVLGMFGFLPVLGFWMIPLGLLILSYDIASVRRQRRKLELWWHRRKEKR